MDNATIRLEILRLSYSHAREIGEVIDRAKALEAYVVQEGKPETGPKDCGERPAPSPGEAGRSRPRKR